MNMMDAFVIKTKRTSESSSSVDNVKSIAQQSDKRARVPVDFSDELIGDPGKRGKFNGLKSLILNENKHAHYIHCFAHQLQLVVIAAAKKCKPVRLFFDSVHVLVNIVGVSCKRKDTLLELHHDKVAEQVEKGGISTGKGKNQEINLTRPGDTRWGSHYKTIVRLFQMWGSVIDTLRIISKDSEENSHATADGLVVKMFDFEFVLVGKLMVRLLGFTNGLSQVLQAKNQNIVHAIGMVGVVKSGLKAYKEDGWAELLKEVTEFCEANNIDVPIMEDIIQSRARQLLDGVQMTYFHRFHRDIFLEAVNAITSEMDSRFSESTCELLLCISCLDPSDSFAKFDRDRLLHLAKLYSEDFSSCEIVELDHQLSLYIHDMRSNTSFFGLSNIGELAKKMVEAQYHIFYRLVYRLVELALVIPVTTATVERCFSAMKVVKTDLRNRMDDDYLSDCLLCYIESTTFKSVELEDILQNFQNSASRRQDLPDISDKFSSTSVVNR